MELIWRKCAKCDGRRVVERGGKISVGVCGACHGNGKVLIIDTTALTLTLHAVAHFIRCSGEPDGSGPEYTILHKTLSEHLINERHAFRKIGDLDKFGRVCGSDYESIDAEAKRKYGAEVGDRVARRLYEAVEEIGDSCVDNYRVCDLANPVDVVVYHRDMTSGCCGSHDEVYVDEETGRKFMVGFNYGH